jgi:hypothetical protein
MYRKFALVGNTRVVEEIELWNFSTVRCLDPSYIPYGPVYDQGKPFSTIQMFTLQC